jgi:hypothetical protein
MGQDCGGAGGWLPPKGSQGRIEAVLASGEQVVLPDEVLISLTQQRREQSKRGSWVEAHHFPRRRRTKF